MVPALCSMRTALLSRHFCPSILTRNGGFRATHKPLCRRLHVATGAFRAPSQAMAGSAVEQEKLASALLDKLRARQAKDAWNTSKKEQRDVKEAPKEEEAALDTNVLPTSFEELGLTEELMAAVRELKISEPTEVQRLAIPAVLDGQDVVIASHTGSGKTLAYMLPLVQALRMDEAETGMIVKSKKPRAIVLCPTRELAEQVLQVAKSISHHARFRSTMISGGFRLRPQTDALNAALDVVVGTPGRLLMHIEEGNIAFRDVKYVVLDEADTMFDRGFGPEVKKFLGPLRNRVSQGGGDFQTVLVTATITKAIQELLDDEFPGIRHIHTSTLHKKVDTSRHHFVKVPGNENKIEALLQVLEPALAKGNHVMVFCNTVASCRAVDHFLNEVNVPCVNYHGEVPAEDRVENLKKFKSGDAAGGPVPALVCTDLAARGLDLVVDHVIMFDFPHNSIDYLHRTGRTARMGAKGKVTSLVTKRDLTLAGRLETAMSRGETLEAVSATREKLLAAKQHEFKVKQKEAFERAAGRGVYLDKPGTKALALAKTKVHRLLGNQPRPKRTVKKGTAGKFGKPKSRAKPVGKARKQRA